MKVEKLSDLHVARQVLEAEQLAIKKLSDSLDQRFVQAVDMIVGCRGHTIVSGIGKSGHIGQKLSSSLSSTGTPSFFLHPAEGSHGDLGMITPDSLVIGISYSGESREMVDLLRFCGTNGIPVIGMTRAPKSTLGRNSDVLLQLPVVEEACPNRLAPTTSTTMTLALCDAVTVAVMERRGFTKEEFGYRHPGGKLGRSLHTAADYVRLHGGDVPSVTRDAVLRDVIHVITTGRHGCAAVVEADGTLAGMVTDGDLRRAIFTDADRQRAEEIMTTEPIVFEPGDQMARVVRVFTDRRVSNAFIVEGNKPVGVIHIKDLLAYGYI